jgi:hypothetical protein
MSTNPLNDISKVYLDQVAEASHLETNMKKRAEENEKARKEMMKTKAYKDMAIAARKKFDEAVDQDSDGDNDFADVRIARMIASGVPKEVAIQKTKDKMYNKKSKKVTKEGYSNWRQELSEVVDGLIDDQQIKEKKIRNKIKTSAINGGIKMSEAVENLGGTLIEMVEIDEVDFIVESVYDELLGEGYEEDDIEEALEFALAEAKVTFGHDTSTGQKKRGNLVAAVGRLARQKLSSKVRGAKTAAKSAIASGARKVAKGALGVARKMEGGDKKPATTTARKPSTYRGAGAGQKERVSSGSYTGPAKKKAEKPSDPWKGTATVPQKPKSKPKAEKPADPWEGSATTPAKPKAKTKKAAAPKTKAPAPANPKRKRKSKLDDLLASVRSEQVQIDEKTLTTAETKKKEELVKSMKKRAEDFEKRYPGRGKEVMYAIATKMAKKMAEDIAIGGPSLTPTPTSVKQKPQNTSAINQVLMAKQKVDRAQADLASKQKMASGKGVNLSSLSS